MVGQEVVAVADQDVLRRLPDPGEVLELVRREQAVGAGDRPALRQQGPEHGKREAGEHDEHRELEAVESEHAAQRCGRARPAGAGGCGGRQRAHGTRSRRRTPRSTWAAAAFGPCSSSVRGRMRRYCRRVARRTTSERGRRAGSSR